MKFSIHKIAVLALLLSAPAPILRAEEIRYQVAGSGTDRAVLSLRGATTQNTATSISADHMTIRVSAVNAEYREVASKSSSSLIKTIQQVRAGARSDLIVSLNFPSEISASPGSSELKLYIKKIGLAADKQTSPVQNQTEKVASKDTSGSKPIAPPTSITQLHISLPNGVLVGGLSPVSKVLRIIAYSIDLFYFWNLKVDLPVSAPSVDEKQLLKEKQDLEKLVKDLTDELAAVRGTETAAEKATTENEATLHD